MRESLPRREAVTRSTTGEVASTASTQATIGSGAGSGAEEGASVCEARCPEVRPHASAARVVRRSPGIARQPPRSFGGRAYGSSSGRRPT